MTDEIKETNMKVGIENAITLISRYPESIRVSLLKYYLLYSLKAESKDEFQQQCVTMKSQLQVLNTKNEKPNVPLTELKAILLSASSGETNETASLTELVMKLVDNEKKTKQAMIESLEEILDRILSSLDPEKANRYLDQSVHRKGVEKEAALYNAMCEKFEQISDYNASGRLVKDFRRLFVEKLK